MLSEVDLKDWVRTNQPIKLYDVRRESVVSTASAPDKPFWFERIDGMYSLCQEIDSTNEVFHIAAWTEVFPWIKKKGK